MSNWILESIGDERIQAALIEVARRLLGEALSPSPAVSELDIQELAFIADGLELAALDAMDDENRVSEMRETAANAFQLLRVLPRSEDTMNAGAHCLRLACLGVIGERGADVARILRECPWPDLPIASNDWGERAMATILEIWLLLARKDGWRDLEGVQHRVLDLRRSQQDHEAAYLNSRGDSARTEAWNLVALYHLAKAAEILAIYTTQGEVDGGFDVRQQLESQFDRALIACERAELLTLHATTRLLRRCAAQWVDNCIWTVTRAVNSRVTRFVKALVGRGYEGHPGRPIFEMLPPQRRTLREEGLLGSGRRSVVVNLPTSSGKTLIAEFRILQALNQFDEQRGWVAYLAPTRALVGQICARLRRDFTELGVVVERVSPALEIDGLETALLTETERSHQFRVLVTTPEKLDLMLRGGWEEKIDRPLTLVVVDEAHNLAVKNRGIKLELLLATINKECRNAQFLLLTPFIRNADEIARWLAPDSYQDIELGLAWQPNDRAIALVRPEKSAKRGAFSLKLETLHTSKQTLAIPETLPLGNQRPLGLSWSDVKNNGSKLAATTAEALKVRGPVIILAGKVPHTWSLARNFMRGQPSGCNDDTRLVQRFLEAELGTDFLLPQLLEYGIGVHHSGLPDEAKALMEWLLSKECIHVLVATTTIAQGVNFPVSGVVLAAHQHPYGQDMSPEEFWNLAGRAGRVDQGSVGIVALAATDEAKAEVLRSFVGKQVAELNSTLVEMVREIIETGDQIELHRLSHKPEWSAFVQYLAHTYRQIGESERFVNEIERILRGALGFESLYRHHPGWARRLLASVQTYGERLAGKPLQLVDSTGFSLETVSNTLVRLNKERITEDIWNPDHLFSHGHHRPLQKLMGVLLEVPELRENLEAATGGHGPNGDLLARMIIDWVNGTTLPDMAKEYFSPNKNGKKTDPTEAMGNCCRNLYGKLGQTASWGLAALQAMTFGDDFENRSEAEQQALRNLPAKVFYGVGTDASVALRLLGVPRGAAPELAQCLNSIHTPPTIGIARDALHQGGSELWTQALGDRGADYHRIWEILESA